MLKLKIVEEMICEAWLSPIVHIVNDIVESSKFMFYC